MTTLLVKHRDRVCIKSAATK